MKLDDMKKAIGTIASLTSKQLAKLSSRIESVAHDLKIDSEQLAEEEGFDLVGSLEALSKILAYAELNISVPGHAQSLPAPKKEPPARPPTFQELNVLWNVMHFEYVHRNKDMTGIPFYLSELKKHGIELRPTAELELEVLRNADKLWRELEQKLEPHGLKVSAYFMSNKNLDSFIAKGK